MEKRTRREAEQTFTKTRWKDILDCLLFFCSSPPPFFHFRDSLVISKPSLTWRDFCKQKAIFCLFIWWTCVHRTKEMLPFSPPSDIKRQTDILAWCFSLCLAHSFVFSHSSFRGRTRGQSGYATFFYSIQRKMLTSRFPLSSFLSLPPLLRSGEA